MEYTIQAVGNWENSDEIEIPALQRGLVWAPDQVELLWDSILRGFPIGAFVVTKGAGIGNQSKRNGRPVAKYFLLDGQQRYNAIIAGFSKWCSSSSSVLWIDLMPPTKTASTRKYWIKVTTKAHPWGYGNDDGCSTLGWAAYRDALVKFGYNADDNVRDVDMGKAWPIKAGCPIPLSEVLSLADGDVEEETFYSNIYSWLVAHPEIGSAAKNRNWDVIRCHAKALYQALRRMAQYRVVTLELSHEALEERDSIYADVNDETSNLEQLFTRLNTLGTPISPYDLRYSAIKAYWGDIARANDALAGEIMPAANLAIVAFRLAESLIDDNSTKFADVPTVQKIRSLGKNRDSAVCKEILSLYDDGAKRLSQYITSVEDTLHVSKIGNVIPSGLPAVLRTSIVINAEDIYLMFLYAAAKGRLSLFTDGSALALWLKWGSIKPIKKIIDEFKQWIDGKIDCSLKDILRRLVDEDSVMFPISVSEFCDEKELFRKQMDWSAFEEQPWYRVFNRFWGQKELVIYATRRYFNREFAYDPAETKFLTGHNKPWDMDHIIPKAWVSRQGVKMGDWKNTCGEWIWSIGNFAPIPFSANRSKSDSAMYSLYEKNAEDLFFDKRVKEIKDYVVTTDDAMAEKFISVTYSRIKELYLEIQRPVLALIND